MSRNLTLTTTKNDELFNKIAQISTMNETLVDKFGGSFDKTYRFNFIITIANFAMCQHIISQIESGAMNPTTEKFEEFIIKKQKECLLNCLGITEQNNKRQSKDIDYAKYLEERFFYILQMFFLAYNSKLPDNYSDLKLKNDLSPSNHYFFSYNIDRRTDFELMKQLCYEK